MRMKYCMGAILAASMIIPSAAHAQQRFWYVIMGSFHYSQMDAARRLARQIRGDCGIDAFYEDAINVEGLNPDIAFVYTGPYRSRSHAETVLVEARYCVGDSYIKSGSSR